MIPPLDFGAGPQSSAREHENQDSTPWKEMTKQIKVRKIEV
jgi:hypothetical protein